MSALSALLRISILQGAVVTVGNPEVLKCAAGVLHKATDPGTVGLHTVASGAVSTLYSVLAAACHPSSSELQTGHKLSLLSLGIRRLCQQESQLADSCTKPQASYLARFWLDAVALVPCWPQNHLLGLLVDDIVGSCFLGELDPAPLVGFFVRHTSALQLTLEPAAAELGVDDRARSEEEQLAPSLAGMLVGGSISLLSSSLSYLSAEPPAIPQTLTFAQHVLDPARPWLGFATMYACTMAELTHGPSPHSDQLVEHWLQFMSILELEHPLRFVVWKALASFCATYRLGDSAVLDRLKDCVPTPEWDWGDQGRQFDEWECLCELLEISVHAWANQEHQAIWRPHTRTDLPPSSQQDDSNTKQSRSTSPPPENSLYHPPTAHCSPPETGVGVTVRLTVHPGGQVKVSLSAAPRPASCLRTTFRTLHNAALDFVRQAHQLAATGLERITQLRHLYQAKASVQKAVFGCSEACDCPAVRLYDSFETFTDPEVVKLLADHLAAYQQGCQEISASYQQQGFDLCRLVQQLQLEYAQGAPPNTHETTLELLEQLSSHSQSTSCGLGEVAGVWCPSLSCFVETVLPLLVRELVTHPQALPKCFVTAFRFVATASSGTRPVSWLNALSTLDTAAWLESRQPSIDLRTELILTASEAASKFLKSTTADGGCAIMGHDEDDSGIRHRCQALECCCKAILALCNFCVEEHLPHVLQTILEFGRMPSVNLPHDTVALGLRTLLTGLCEAVETTSHMDASLLVESCRLIQTHLLTVRSGRTRLQHTSIVLAAPLLYRLVELMVSRLIEQNPAQQGSNSYLFTLCWRAISQAFLPWMVSKVQGQSAMDCQDKSESSFEDNFPWIVTHQEIGRELLTALHGVASLLQELDGCAYGWMLALILSQMGRQDCWVLQTCVKAMEELGIPWFEVVPDTELLQMLTDVSASSTSSGADVLWAVCSQMQLLNPHRDAAAFGATLQGRDTSEYYSCLFELLLHWCKAAGPEFPYNGELGKSQLQAVRWNVLGVDGIDRIMSSCNMHLPVADLLRSDALISAPEWCGSALHLVVTVLESAAGFGADADSDIWLEHMESFAKFSALGLKLCTNPVERRDKTDTLLKTISNSVHNRLEESAVRTKAHGALNETIGVLSTQPLLQRVDSFSFISQCAPSYPHLGPLLLTVSCECMNDFTNVVETALLMCLESQEPWENLLTSLEPAITCDLLELCVCSATPVTLFVWAVHPNTTIQMQDLALSLGRLKLQQGQESFALPLWVLCLSVGSLECAGDAYWHEHLVPSLVEQLCGLAAPAERGLLQLLGPNADANPQFDVVVSALWQFVAKHMSRDPEQRSAAENFDQPLGLGGFDSADVSRQGLAEAARTAEALLNDPCLTERDIVTFFEHVAGHAFGNCNWLQACIGQIKLQVQAALEAAN
eukprot:TRINITY_DN6668_c0_g1_i1.p1 TRINITY_DN6668_c0_g1~~TRINITY_DN6668_c0_g1_i1.p1  ORF type:complete len:1414 (-),score=298.86 TRINITY_DN6668_c0_g1_i1:372-4613(-)